MVGRGKTETLITEVAVQPFASVATNVYVPAEEMVNVGPTPNGAPLSHA